MQKEFKNIVDEYNGILYKIGRSYSTEEADFKDLYQEMLIQLWKSFARFKGESKISTWIYRVALNTALTFQRNQKRKKTPDSLENLGFKLSDQSGEALNRAFQKEEKIELLYHCINLLKKDDRAIVLLHLEGKKYDEIAEITGLKTNHIGVKLLRIKKQLHSLLEKNNFKERFQ